MTSSWPQCDCSPFTRAKMTQATVRRCHFTRRHVGVTRFVFLSAINDQQSTTTHYLTTDLLMTDFPACPHSSVGESACLVSRRSQVQSRGAGSISKAQCSAVSHQTNADATPYLTTDTKSCA